MDTNALLTERQKTHGDFTVHAHVTQHLKDVVHNIGQWHDLSDDKKEAIDMILHKIGRIVAGNPNHADHWDDIAGYATLASQRCADPYQLPPLDPSFAKMDGKL